jgi:hypothetical protein
MAKIMPVANRRALDITRDDSTRAVFARLW